MSRKNVRLNSLIDELFNVKAPPMPPGVKTEEAKATTIRPSAEIAHFFQYHADRLDISMQDMMMLSLKAVAQGSMRETEQTFQLIVDRFKTLFEVHKVPQIHAKFVIDACEEVIFPLGALTNNRILLESYTPALKETLQKIFHVRSSWLDGVEDNAVIADPIYSRDHAFSVWDAVNAPLPLRGIDLISKEFLAVKSNRQMSVANDQTTPNTELLIFIVRNIKLDKHMEFRTFELTGIYPTSNIEARACAQALLGMASREGSEILANGIAVSHDDYSAMKSGRLPALCLNNGFPTTWDLTNLIKPDMASGSETLSDLLRMSN